MNVLGAGVLVIAIAMGVTIVGMVRNSDRLIFGGLYAVMGMLVLGIAALGFAAIFGNVGPSVAAYHCYQAIPHSTTTLVPSGKVLIPITSTSMDFIEVDCP